MTNKDFKPEIQVAIQTAQKAGKYLLEIFKSDHKTEETSKGVKDIVTQADIEAENIIKEELKSAFPAMKIISEIGDKSGISQSVTFKGGSCAALLGYLDRFSVDLDFDLLSEQIDKKDQLRRDLHDIFANLGLTIDQESKTQ